jgi:hypothetical protein
MLVNWQFCDKNVEKFRFSNMCKTWGRIRTRISIVLMLIRIWIGINMGWVRIGINDAIRNTAANY